jgi:hypothetical protein
MAYSLRNPHQTHDTFAIPQEEEYLQEDLFDPVGALMMPLMIDREVVSSRGHLTVTRRNSGRLTNNM